MGKVSRKRCRLGCEHCRLRKRSENARTNERDRQRNIDEKQAIEINRSMSNKHAMDINRRFINGA